MSAVSYRDKNNNCSGIVVNTSFCLPTGSVNEAGVFTLRSKQQDGSGGRRSKRTTTTTTSTASTGAGSSTSSSTSSSASSSTSGAGAVDGGEAVVEPAALLAGPGDGAWRTESSNGSTGGGESFALSMSSSQPPIELVVKPLSKVVLPCELEGNSSKLLMPAVR